MPFTLAHPAAVMPLMRRPFVGTALVGGAMAPDVPYFVRATPLEVTAQSWYEPFTNATTSHSLTGLVGVALPLGLLIYLLLRAAIPPVEWVVGTVVGFAALGTVAAVVSVLTTFDSSASLSTRDSVETILSSATMGGGAAVALAAAVAMALWWITHFRVTRRVR